MNFIEICQAVATEAGITSTGPASVTGQSGILAKVVKWVKLANKEIQLESNGWNFMWQMASPLLIPGTKLYYPADLQIADLRHIKSITLQGSSPLTCVAWDDWQSEVSNTANTTAQQPSLFTTRPDGRIEFYPTPAIASTLDVEYFINPVDLVNDTDTSIIPIDYHNTIIAKAIMYYSIHEDDTIRYQQARMEYLAWLNKMNGDLKPKVVFG
jgi:hypothetical protein